MKILEEVILKDSVKIKVKKDYIGTQIKNAKSYFEEEILINFLDYIPHGGIIFDIGANIGNHTLYFSRYVKPRKIFSFEPSAELFEVLSENVVINQIHNAQLMNIAVGDKEEKGILRFNEENTGASKMELASNGDIKVRPIDILGIDLPDFVKIDVEGFELNVLKGMVETLKKKGPTLWVEIHSENYYLVDTFLSDLGYVQVDRWLDNFIYIKPVDDDSYLKLFDLIKRKPLDRFNTKIKEINLKYRNITEQNKNYQNRVSILEKEKTSEKFQMGQLEKELNELKRVMPILESKNTMSKTLGDLEKKLLEKEIEVKHAKELSNLEIYIAELKTERNFLQIQLDELKEKNLNNENFTKLYYRENADLQVQKKINELLVNESNRLKLEEDRINVLKENLTTLEQVLEEKQNQLEVTTEQSKSYIQTINEKESILEDKTKQLNNLNDQYLILEEKFKLLQKQLNKEFQEKERLESEREANFNLVVKYETLKKEFNALQEKHNNSLNSIEKLKKDNNNHLNLIEQLQLQREALVSENVDLKTEVENEILDKIKLLNKEELFVSQLESELINTRKIEKEKSELLNKNNKLEKQLANIKNKYNALAKSKLGRITTKYWLMRKQLTRGK